MVIVVLGGTGDGRKLVHCLVEKGHKVGVIPVSEYGKELAQEEGAMILNEVSAAKLQGWWQKNNIRCLVDARHPFAADNRQGDSDPYAFLFENSRVPYYRLGREETIVEENELINPVYTIEEAAVKAAGLGKCIFLATGSNGLEPFLKVKNELGVRLVVRVLPEHRVIRKCQDMGIKPKDIVAMQGPFSKQVNKALFKMYRASVVVTKDSGKAGGIDNKLAAALSLKIPVVLIKQKNNGPVYSWQEVLALLSG
jgi:precorrin-6A/cobalt-precorrin-6A reductase